MFGSSAGFRIYLGVEEFTAGFLRPLDGLTEQPKSRLSLEYWNDYLRGQEYYKTYQKKIASINPKHMHSSFLRM
jgi:hypothetical protein